MSEEELDIGLPERAHCFRKDGDAYLCMVCDPTNGKKVTTTSNKKWRVACQRHAQTNKHIARANVFSAAEERGADANHLRLPINLDLAAKGLDPRFVTDDAGLRCTACDSVVSAERSHMAAAHCRGAQHIAAITQAATAAAQEHERATAQRAAQEASALGHRIQQDGSTTENGSSGSKRKCVTCSTPQASVEFESDKWAVHAKSVFHEVNSFLQELRQTLGLDLFSKVGPHAQRTVCRLCDVPAPASLEGIMDHVASRKHRQQPIVAHALAAAPQAEYTVATKDLKPDIVPLHAHNVPRFWSLYPPYGRQPPHADC